MKRWVSAPLSTRCDATKKNAKFHKESIFLDFKKRVDNSSIWAWWRWGWKSQGFHRLDERERFRQSRYKQPLMLEKVARLVHYCFSMDGASDYQFLLECITNREVTQQLSISSRMHPERSPNNYQLMGWTKRMLISPNGLVLTAQANGPQRTGWLRTDLPTPIS